MRYEVNEILLDNSIECLLSTSSYEYAQRYFRFLKYRYGSYRSFFIRDKKKGLNYEEN